MWRPLVVGCIVISSLWMIIAGPLLRAGAADVRMLAAFITDEVMHVNMLHQALAERTMRLIFQSYGHLYFNIALAPLHALKLAGLEPSELGILFWLRSLAFLFALATILVVFIWASIDIGVVAAIVATLVMLTSKPLLLWSTISHPDTAQMLFLTLALYWCARLHSEFSDRSLAAASAAAGLAFASKYGGIFVLPVIAWAAASDRLVMSPGDARQLAHRLRIAVITAGVAAIAVASVVAPAQGVALLSEDGRADVPGTTATLALARDVVFGVAIACVVAGLVGPLWQRLARSTRLMHWIRSMVVATAAFTIAFVCASPYSLRKLAFLKGLYFEGNRLAGPSMSTAIGQWLQTFNEALGPIVLAIPLGVALVWGERSRSRRSLAAVLLAFFAIYVAVLLTRVRVPADQYLLPVIPVCALLTGYVAQWVVDRVPFRRAVAAGIVILFAVAAVPSYVNAREQLLHRDRTAGAAIAGRWLSCAVRHDARVVYDYLSYVPPSFADAHPTWGGTPAWRDSLNPDVIVVATPIATNNAGVSPNQEYYACLADGSCGFDRLFGNADVHIYVKRSDAAALATGAACAERR